jgi:hypothetical protein
MLAGAADPVANIDLDLAAMGQRPDRIVEQGIFHRGIYRRSSS